MQVEWRKAVRERSYKLAHDQRRYQRLDGEQLKKRLYFEVINTDAVMGRLKRERTLMEEKLARYNTELAKIKSQQMLRHMDGAGAEEEPQSAGQRHGQSAPFEFVIQTPSEADEAEPVQPPVFVSRLPGSGGSATPASPRRSIASASGQMFELTESEDELVTDFLERQRASDEAASASASGAPRVLIGGLSLEQFMKKCRSRHLMDSAIERAETFVDDWRETSGANGGDIQRRSRRRHKTAGTGRRVPLEEPKEEQPNDEVGPGGQKAEELERLERDFRTLLQEAKKARYLRGRNPEILERDRELTTDEIFQSAKPIG
ncbi:hypothetical protein BOX15_Mlig014336g2 [Macrostomum lignano]|uniref:Uncharacterized protein n=1 Tax=Macrostomum lignano TaxID=282301 RepID=A0A267EBT1_9PLAT|nr:hypothetical protein BOX15_Mlig014336g1 [Macrostomum lignano]PAA92014.1 hypothetical protein BOX15_Mlig014336g2 [Macrostomum lignano]